MKTENQTPQAGPGQEGQQESTAVDGLVVNQSTGQVNFSGQVSQLIEGGCLCLPASSKTKHCDGIPWGNYQQPISLGQFKGLQGELDGCCIITGKRSRNLEVLDFDRKIELQAFNEVLRQFRALVEAEQPGLFNKLVIEKSQSGGRHVLFRCTEIETPGNQKLAYAKVEVDGPGKHEYQGKEYKAEQDQDGKYHIYPCLIETRGEGGLLVCHPTPGYTLTHNSFDAIPDIAAAERATLFKCAKALSQHVEPQKKITGRENLSGDDSRPGDDFNQRGDIIPTLEKHGWTLLDTVGDYTHLRRPGKAQGCSASLIDGKTFYPFTTSTEFEPETGYSPFAVYAILEHEGDFQAAARGLANQGYGKLSASQDIAWGDPKPLPDGLPPVPEFEPLLLPETFRPWLTDIAERTQCPLDYLAVGAMIALSGVVGRKITIKPKRKDNWWVVPNLWGAVVGPPGVLKTPALSEAIKPLKRLEVEAQEKHSLELQQYQEDKQVFQALKGERDREIKQAYKQGRDPREILQKYSEPEEPTHKRYLINDTTVEALTEIMQANPLGVTAFRDELISLLKMLDKEGQEHARGFYLEAWEGRTGYSSDRIGRGHVYIPHSCLSLVGGIQPGRLQTYILEAVKGGQGDDGLIQRFQLLVWPDISREWRDIDRWPDTEAKNRAFELFTTLDQRPAEDLSYHFDPAAQELFIEWRTQLERKIRKGNEHPTFEAHLSKYRSLIPSLALLLALADNPHLEGKIPLGAMEKAAAWAEYLEQHARRVYSSVMQGAGLAAEALAKKIKAGEIHDKATVRSIHRKGWARLDTPELVFDGLYYLEELAWVRVVKEHTGGRPQHIVRLNPKVKFSDPPG